MNVEIEEACKTITKYMGADALYAIYIQEATESETKGEYSEYPYLKSLNTLIPVWEKLGIKTYSFNISKCWDDKPDFEEVFFNVGRNQGRAITIEEAALLATAKAILAIQ